MRYSRQEAFIGKNAQKTLRKALVTIVGCGGTGTAAAEYLARAGVNLRLVDRDIVAESDLHRQLYSEEDLGKPKAYCLKNRLLEINSDIYVTGLNEDLNPSNVHDLIFGTSLVIDGTDNMLTRFLINDFCLKNRIPFTYAAAIKSEGLFTLIVPRQTPCLQCFVPLKSAGRLDTCETAGVLGPAVGTIGLISATEAIKHLLRKDTISGRMLHVNFYRNLYDLIELKKRKNCAACNGQYNFLELPKNNITRLCGGTYQYLFENPANLFIIADKIEKTGEFKVAVRGKGFLKLKYKDYVVSLFRNRMLIENVYSERAVKMIASRLVSS